MMSTMSMKTRMERRNGAESTNGVHCSGFDGETDSKNLTLSLLSPLKKEFLVLFQPCSNEARMLLQVLWFFLLRHFKIEVSKGIFVISRISRKIVYDQVNIQIEVLE
jgi:hypothetical protein